MLLIALCTFQLAGCSSGGSSDSEGSDTVGPALKPDVFSLKTSQISVKSDDSDSATITATVLSKDRVPVEGVEVEFETIGEDGNPAGKISAASVATDSKGEASIVFSSGTIEQINQVVTIEARVDGISGVKSVPILVTGTTITLTSAGSTNLEIGGAASDTLTIALTDAGGRAINNTEIALTADPAGRVNIAPAAGYSGYTTDVSGVLKVYVTGANAGVATVTAQALGAVASESYSVGAVGAVFGIVTPGEDPFGARCNDAVLINVAAPAQTSVVFATTLGTWDGGADAVVTRPVVDGFASATFTSPLAGLATIQVYDPNDPSTTDITTVAFSASSQQAAKIVLQSTAYVVLPSVGVTHTATLTAKVTTAADQAVGGAPVHFSILDPVGGGEKISPVVVFTNASGFASATFTSGSVPTGAPGMTLTARVVGSAVTPSSIRIVIGGTAGSVFIGRGSEITVLNATTYALPMSVLVADSSGAGMAGQEVSLTVWPAAYSAGEWYDYIGANEDFRPYISGTFFNEDVNENLILDPGEDVNQDGALTPPNSAGGGINSLSGQITVVTGENGVADFDLVYLKNSAVWITDRVRASTLVQGTEISSSQTFVLPYAKKEGEAGLLDDSAWPVTLKATAGSSVTYALPAFEGGVENTYSSTLSPISAIDAVTGIYTFDAASAAPGVYWDYVTISRYVFVNTIVPIRIIVQ